jgi:ligand-binding SRPBCC domain-containing protein
MRVRNFESQLWLPQTREKVFSFFSNPQNLEAITPPWLHFHTVTSRPIEMHPGAVIDYKLRIHGFPLRWRSKITVWDPPARFVDEQIRGPYQLWIHEHTFSEREGGTLVCDHVKYAAPFDWLAYPLLVRRDVERIFRFRCDVLRRRFAAPA